MSPSRATGNSDRQGKGTLSFLYGTAAGRPRPSQAPYLQTDQACHYFAGQRMAGLVFTWYFSFLDPCPPAYRGLSSSALSPDTCHPGVYSTRWAGNYTAPCHLYCARVTVLSNRLESPSGLAHPWEHYHCFSTDVVGALDTAVPLDDLCLCYARALSWAFYDTYVAVYKV